MKPEVSERLLIETIFRNHMEVVKGEELTVDKLTGDASTRKYYRVLTSESSYVACLDEPLVKGAPEHKFVQAQNAFKESGVRVPEIFIYIPEKGFILEEDLGNETLLATLSMNTKEEEENKLYTEAIDQLLRIHSIDFDRYKNSADFGQAFDEEKLAFENGITKKYFLNLFLGHQLTDKQEKIIDSTFGEINKDLQDGEFVLCHRDYHSRNLMLKDGDLVVIDFQDARKGLPQYDLASLLDDCYFQLERTQRFNLLNYYYENSEVSRNQGSWDLFRERYDIMSIQRTYKAIGSFAYIYNKRNDARYLKYIGFAFEKLRNTMKKYDRYDELRKVLSGIYYEY